ncbi:MAG: hypothetical protein U1E53_14960 [Dongiaceae bacterium]
MMRKIAIAVALVLSLGAAGALAAGAPVDLSKQQLSRQDQETRVLNLLSAAGYTNIGALEKTGTTWTTTATKGGQTGTVVVDPMAGTIGGM